MDSQMQEDKKDEFRKAYTELVKKASNGNHPKFGTGDKLLLKHYLEKSFDNYNGIKMSDQIVEKTLENYSRKYQ